MQEFVYKDGEEQLRQKVLEGIDALDRGDMADGKEVFERLRKKAHELTSGN